MLELDTRFDTSAVAARVELRRFEPEDWPAAREIYWHGIRSGLASFETAVPGWEAWDAAHLAEHRLVATIWDEVAGWAALAPVSTRRCYSGVAENSIYVHRDRRRQGIGRLLLEGLVQRAERAGIWTIQTSIFPENDASLRLHLACGFRIVGRRERIARRDGIWRDTYLLERRRTEVST